MLNLHRIQFQRNHQYVVYVHPLGTSDVSLDHNIDPESLKNNKEIKRPDLFGDKILIETNLFADRWDLERSGQTRRMHTPQLTKALACI